MMTASEYSYMSDARKREYALAVDAMDNLCRDSISLLHRMQTALFNGDNGRAEYERYEIALMMKRNEIFSRQFEYQMAGINIQISTDDRGTPIRVRRPAGFVSLEMLAANAAAQNASEDETILERMDKLLAAPPDASQLADLKITSDSIGDAKRTLQEIVDKATDDVHQANEKVKRAIGQ